MNKLPYDLQEIEIKLAQMLPESDSTRDAELLRYFIATQPTAAPNLKEELARAKRHSFMLGGILGLCAGAMVMFLTLTVFVAEVPAEPVTVSLVEVSLESLQTAAQADVIRQLVPPPSAFWIPFSLAALLVVSVVLLTRHLRVQLVL